MTRAIPGNLLKKREKPLRFLPWHVVFQPAVFYIQTAR